MKSIDPAKLRELAAELPRRIHEAAQAVLAAEQRLTLVLIYRATGNAVKGSKLGVARMALARTQRELEDLRRIQSILPASLEQAREPHSTEPAAPVA